MGLVTVVDCYDAQRGGAPTQIPTIVVVRGTSATTVGTLTFPGGCSGAAQQGPHCPGRMPPPKALNRSPNSREKASPAFAGMNEQTCSLAWKSPRCCRPFPDAELLTVHLRFYSPADTPPPEVRYEICPRPREAVKFPPAPVFRAGAAISCKFPRFFRDNGPHRR